MKTILGKPVNLKDKLCLILNLDRLPALFAHAVEYLRP